MAEERERGSPRRGGRATGAAHKLLFDRASRLVAIGLLAAAFVLPPEGLRVKLCMLRRLSGLPCPGCGTVRSLTCIAHGRLARAAQFQPFGYVFFATFALIAVHTVLPRAWRRRVTAWFEWRDRAVTAVYYAFLALFLVFGLVRIPLVAWMRRGGEPPRPVRWLVEAHVERTEQP